jgi:nitroimidazol reductase NimA-like FMN-containing flavoprotein (pyridoxamine 5'-phosphate oxidase superfamily)
VSETTTTATVEELDIPTCLSLLRTTTLGRVAFLAGDEPLILPVNYKVDRGTVLFRSASGSKLRAGLDQAPVAFEADGHDDAGGSWWSVVLRGRAEVVHLPDDLEDVEGVDVRPVDPRRKPFTLRVVWETMTGRRIGTTTS